MFMWHERQACSRCQKITSYLVKFIKGLPHNAGGQNKSHIILKFLLYIVWITQIETVDQKFFVSGHSFMVCSQDFGLIEKAKKKNSYIYLPEHWISVLAESSREFIVNEDFITMASLSKRSTISLSFK